MAMTVKVQYEDGSPCPGTRVTAWVSGEGNEEKLTGSDGTAAFSYGPGRGTVYCDGQAVGSERSLSSYEVITCRPSGPFSYTYS
jgi:hypothetical protein